jgi:hypothetical protein
MIIVTGGAGSDRTLLNLANSGRRIAESSMQGLERVKLSMMSRTL